jgi:N-acetylmuramoyl-L-alanine amidase
MQPQPLYPLVIVDYGHGGEIDGEYQTAGKRYYHTDRAGGPVVLSLYEGIRQRQIMHRVICGLLALGVRVVDCVARREWTQAQPPATWRDLEQRDVSLAERVRYANQHPDGVLCSGHSNAIGSEHRGTGRSPNGIEVYTSRGQTRADHVATTLHAALSERMPAAGMGMRRGDWSDGDCDYEAGFYMLRKTVMPAVLIEAGYHTNRRDAEVLSSEAGQAVLADAIVAGLLPWLRF